MALLLLAGAQASIVRASAVIYIAGALSGGLQVFDTAIDKVTAQTLLSYGDKSTAAISNLFGAYLLSGREVLRFDGRTNAVVGSIGMGREGSAFALVKGPVPSERIYVANGPDNAVTATIPVGMAPSVAVASPDGQRLVVANRDGNSLSVINAATNTLQTTIAIDGSPSALAFSPDGNRLYVAIYFADQPTSHIAVFNPATNALVTTIANIEYRVNGIAVTP